MGKNTLRKKTKSPGSALRFDAANPGQIGVPCDVYMVEQICLKCRSGFMRPTGRVLEIQPGKPGLVHECSNDLCDETHTFNQPFPRPDFTPRLDIRDRARDIGAVMAQMYEQHQKEDGDGTSQDTANPTDPE